MVGRITPMKQSEALDILMMGKNVFLTGQAGSGKTFLINQYVRFLKKNKVGVAVTASTGIAATHLGGTTIHSWSGIGIKKVLTDGEIAKLNSSDKAKNRINSAKVLIIDEISMLHSYRLDTINKICKVLRQNNLPFGGLQVILCGDFFQLPPIKDEGEEKSSFAYKSAIWEELNLSICYLNEQHRQWDEDYLRVLNDIRTSSLEESTFEKLKTRLNGKLEDGIVPTKLYSHNIDVDAINNFELSKIEGPHHIYEMQTSGKKELITALKKGCLAPEALTLKKGAVVMFVKNNPAKGYINGTLGKVIGFDEDNYPHVTTYAGREIIASPASWTVEENDKILAEISQIPLRLAWAITIHKSQGMSLDAAEVDLSKSFSYGMGYVALSRLRSLEGLRLLGINQMAFLVDKEISALDLELKQASNAASSELGNMRSSDIKKFQREFLNHITAKGRGKKEDPIDKIFGKIFGS